MNKPKFETPDMVEKNIEKLAEIFPNCITEARDENGKLKKAVNFEMLQQILSTEFPPEGSAERYEFTWVGKRAAIAEANKPIRKTLRPCKTESKNWDTTENLYIEGDNLEVLKLLQESYLGKVKMIYIDPPYNTGNDFIYRDDFKQTQQEYDEQVGLFDEDDNRLFKNTETNGRFHSDWCSMIYSRLMLAKNFLSDDGVIFISIDDNEQENLKKICNEVFGESNFIGCICRATGTTTGQDANKIGSSVDYCFVFAKSSKFILKGVELDKKDLKRFNLKDEKGNYSILQLRKTGSNDKKEDRPNMFYEIEAPDGSNVIPFGPGNYLSRWRVSKETYKSLKEKNMIVWKKQKIDHIMIDEYTKSEWIPYVKYYLEGRTKQISNLFQNIEGNKKGSLTLKEMFNNINLFENPKPVEFIKILEIVATNRMNVIMDFFSGSATTAHAVMQLNAEDGGHRKFIMVQLPEVCDEKSEAYKAGYKNICEIGKERIRRAGEKIKADNPLTTQDLDIGFRVFKVDSSNMNDVYYSAGEYSQDMLVNLEDNIKPDRTDLDLLFGCLLDWGLPISLPYTSEQIENCTVHTYNDGDLVACFDENIPESVIKEIAKRKPLRAVFRDAGFGSSPEKINVTEIFKMLAPDIDVKVI